LETKKPKAADERKNLMEEEPLEVDTEAIETKKKP